MSEYIYAGPVVFVLRWNTFIPAQRKSLCKGDIFRIEPGGTIYICGDDGLSECRPLRDDDIEAWNHRAFIQQ